MEDVEFKWLMVGFVVGWLLSMVIGNLFDLREIRQGIEAKFKKEAIA